MTAETHLSLFERRGSITPRGLMDFIPERTLLVHVAYFTARQANYANFHDSCICFKRPKINHTLQVWWGTHAKYIEEVLRNGCCENLSLAERIPHIVITLLACSYSLRARERDIWVRLRQCSTQSSLGSQVTNQYTKPHNTHGLGLENSMRR